MSEEKKKGLFARLREGLSKTRGNMTGRVDEMVRENRKVDEDFYEELEDILVMADCGLKATTVIIDELRARVKKENVKDAGRAREILKEIAEAGNDCIIVGRDADVILQDYHPFRVFVCAEMSSRIARCARYEAKKDPAERLSEKEILRNIRRIDRNRKQIREILTGKSAGDGSSFDLTVNATNWEIKKLAAAVADFSGKWFEK